MERDFIVNSSWECTTTNYYDDGARYYYFLKNGSLFYQKEGDPVKPLSNPFMNCFIEQVSADSNRLFVLTRDKNTNEKKLYWCCIIKDVAEWVKYIFKVADILASPNESINTKDKDLGDIDKLIHFILIHLPVFKNLLINELSLIIEFMEMKIDAETIEKTIIDKFQNIESKTKPVEKKQALKELLNYIFTFMLRNNFDGVLRVQEKEFSTFDKWVTAYRDWVIKVHHSLVWNEIKRTRVKVTNPQLFRKEKPLDGAAAPEPIEFDLEMSNIIGIAIGNWHQTVITLYLLVTVDISDFNKIFQDPTHPELKGVTKPALLLYIDEEPIMNCWKIVPGKMDEPYPLLKTSRLNASHSVISSTKKTGDSHKIFWIRHDYHNFEDFAWFPLNWTEFYYKRNFDVDTLRLYINDLDPDQNKSFILNVFLPEILGYFFDEHKGRKPEFTDELMNLFKETSNHHPGWHSIENPVAGSDTIHLKVCYEKPWPVPYINQFMLLILNLSKEYQTLPIGDEKLQNYSRAGDMILELLKMLHASAQSKTKEVNKIEEITQKLGFLGENPIIPSYNYPVELIIKEKSDSYKISSIPAATHTHMIQWEDLSTTKQYTLMASNNRYVSAPGNNGKRLCADEKKAVDSTHFIFYRLDYNTFCLLTPDGRYGCIENTKKKNFVVKKKTPGTWESFTIIPVEVAIMAGNGKYLYIDTYPGKAIEVLAGKDNIDNRTTFILDKVGDTTFTIQCRNTNRYLVAPNKKDAKVTTDIDTKLKLTHFKLNRISLDQWVIQTAKGHYVSIKNSTDNKLYTISKTIGKDALFTIIFLKVAIQTNSKKYISRVWMSKNLIADKFDARRSLFEIKTPDNNYFK
ncbi:MAG: hypothetical protein JXJ04_19250 [Spirochaetales bacterium]|nr:hypothetical protein [Spirochaetales bacterium]